MVLSLETACGIVLFLIILSLVINKLRDFHSQSIWDNTLRWIMLWAQYKFRKRDAIWVDFAAGLVDSVWHSLSSKWSFMGEFWENSNVHNY